MEFLESSTPSTSSLSDLLRIEISTILSDKSDLRTRILICRIRKISILWMDLNMEGQMKSIHPLQEFMMSIVLAIQFFPFKDELEVILLQKFKKSTIESLSKWTWMQKCKFKIRETNIKILLFWGKILYSAIQKIWNQNDSKQFQMPRTFLERRKKHLRSKWTNDISK